MSFPKAKIKRFNEVVDPDAVPPVGSYNLNNKSEISGSFDKADRFKKPSDPPASISRTESKDSLTGLRLKFDTPTAASSIKDDSKELRSRVRELQDRLETVICENNLLKQQIQHEKLEVIASNNVENSEFNGISPDHNTEMIFRKEIYNLRLELETKTMDAYRWRQTIAELMSTGTAIINNAYQENKIALEEKINSILEQLTASESKLEDLRGFMIVANGNLENEKIKCCQLENCLKTEYESRSEILRTLDSLKLDLENAVCEANLLRDKESVMKEVINEKDSEIISLKEAISTIDTTCEQKAQMEDKFRNLLEQLNSTLKDLDDLKTALTAANSNLEDEKMKCCQLDKSLQIELEVGSEQLRVLNLIKQDLNDAVCKSNCLKEEVALKTKLVKEQELEINVLKEEIANINNQFQEKEVVLKDKITDLVQQVSSGEKDLNDTKLSVIVANNALEDEKVKCCQLEDRLKSELALAAQKLNSMKNDLEDAVYQVNLLRNNESLKEELIKSKDLEINNLKEATSIIESTYEREKVEMEEKFNNLLEQLHNTEKELNDLKITYIAASNNLEDEKMKCSQLDSCLQFELEVGSENSRVLNLIKQDLEDVTCQSKLLSEDVALKINLVKEQELEINSLKEEIAHIKTEFQEKEDVLKIQNKNLLQQINSVENELEGLQHSIMAANNTLEEEKVKYCLLEDRLKAELQVGAENLQALNLTKNDLEDTVCQANQLKSDLFLKEELAKKKDIEINSIKDELERNILNSKERESQLQDRINEEILKCQLCESTKISEIENLNREVQDLTRMLEDRKNEMAIAKDELQIFTSEMEAVMLARNTQIAAMETASVEKSNLIASLKSEILEISVERDCSAEDIKELKMSLARKDEELSQFQDVITKNHQLMSLKGSLVQDLEECHIKLSNLASVNECLTNEKDHCLNSLNEVSTSNTELRSQITDLLNQISIQSSNYNQLEEREKSLIREIEVMEDKLSLLQRDFYRSNKDWRKKLNDAEKELERCKNKMDSEGIHNEELLQKLTSDYEDKIRNGMKAEQSRSEELIKWRTLYEQLKAKIAPFQKQLDAYEIENQLLESNSKEASEHMKKMGDQLATLVGHHNHRQRIHYVNQLKEECFRTKEENGKLRSEVLKLRKGIIQSTSTRKFDPSNAFQHAKENKGTPLKDNNR